MKVPEQYRVTNEVANKMKNFFNVNPVIVNSWVTKPNCGKFGVFILPNPRTMKGMFILCRASDAMGWDHVSVSIPTENRCPTWEEMCFVKSLFWDEEDVVVQFHPAKKDYVNNHEFCLHLWKSQNIEIKTPPSALVGTN